MRVKSKELKENLVKL